MSVIQIAGLFFIAGLLIGWFIGVTKFEIG